MISPQALDQLKALAQEVSAREGCVLYDLDFGNGGRILRVYIDKNAPGGVGVDECANVSRGLSLLLDVNDLIPGGRYELEVSSPGLDRVLREPWHFTHAIGKRIRVKGKESFPLPEGAPHKGPVKSVEGELVAVEQGMITVREKWDWQIPLEMVQKANIVFEFKSNTK